MLTDPHTLHLSEVQAAAAGNAYLIGAIVGALFFARLTDMYGRKMLFMVTLGVYLIPTVAGMALLMGLSLYLTLRHL